MLGKKKVVTTRRYILRKRTQNLKNITLLHFMRTFHNFAFKLETVWATRVFQPILETRNANDLYECAWLLSWHKVIIWSLKNRWLLNFNFNIWGSWNFVCMTLGSNHDSNHATYIYGEKVCHNILKQIYHFAWRYEVCPLNYFSCTKVNHLI